MQKVLIIGLGVITQEINNKLQPKYDVKIYSEHEKKLTNRDLIQTVKTSDYIISCFSNCKKATKFWTNKNMIKALNQSKVICIEMGTLDVKSIQEIYKAIKKEEIKFIECPFTGSKRGAETGELTLFLFSNFKLDKSTKNLLQVFSKRIIYFGTQSEPTKFKLIYNAWGFCILYLVAEFFPIFRDSFDDTESEIIFDTLKNVGWMSSVCRDKLDTIKSKDFNQVAFSLENAIKDIDCIQSSIENLNSNIVNEIFDKYREMCNESTNKKDFSIIGAYYDHT